VSGYSNLIQPTKTDSINRPLRQNNKTKSECNMKTIKQARKDANYTMDMVAEELGVDQSSIAHWEGGYRPIPDSRLEQMLLLYGAHPNEVELPERRTSKQTTKQSLYNDRKKPRADALRFALAQIVSQEHIEKVIELCAMIYELENK
jgi:transcriptional regulator with XRE-family HTH domain